MYIVAGWCDRETAVGARFDSVLGRFEIRHRQLEITLAVPGVLLEGKGQVDRAAMLGDECLAFGCPPRDPTHDAAILLEGHFQVTVFHASRAIDDLDPV